MSEHNFEPVVMRLLGVAFVCLGFLCSMAVRQLHLEPLSNPQASRVRLLHGATDDWASPFKLRGLLKVRSALNRIESRLRAQSRATTRSLSRAIGDIGPRKNIARSRRNLGPRALVALTSANQTESAAPMVCGYAWTCA